MIASSRTGGEMGRKSFTFVAAFLAGVAAFAFVAPAAASSPLPAAGVETFVPNFTLERGADGNVFLSALNPGAKTGTFTGTQLFEGTLALFRDGSFNFEGTITFTGDVADCGTGTVVLRVEGAGFLLPDGTAVFTRNHQHTLFGQGTLPVHASLDSLGVGTTLAYAGEYHC
jgi:hypothetical protein